jgi:hypothetical protein
MDGKANNQADIQLLAKKMIIHANNCDVTTLPRIEAAFHNRNVSTMFQMCAQACVTGNRTRRLTENLVAIAVKYGCAYVFVLANQQR